MNDILNKEYKRKNTIGSDIFIPMSIDENNFVIFANGAKCKMETFMTDFELNSSVLNESTLSNSLEINPDTFFDSPTTTVHDPLLDQLEKVMKDPNAIQPSEKLMQSESLDHIGTGLENRIAEPATHGNSNNIPFNSPLADLKPAKQRLPEYDVFDRVKKAEEIDINIPVSIKLPRPEKIDALNDMFETSFTSYLAKQFVEDYIINNSKLIEKQIQEQIEEWMESELYDNKPKRKPAKKTAKKSIPLKTTDALYLVETNALPTPDPLVSLIPENNDIGDLLRNNGQPSKPWNGDLKTLITITSDEQYNAVKKKYDYLVENDPHHADVERFEGLIELYTQN